MRLVTEHRTFFVTAHKQKEQILILCFGSKKRRPLLPLLLSPLLQNDCFCSRRWARPTQNISHSSASTATVAYCLYVSLHADEGGRSYLP